MEMVKVKLKEDIEIFGKKFYAGQVIEVSKEIYKQIKDKVEKVKEKTDAKSVREI
ncbi:MAG: hypothetical protein QW228_06320 [Candidatus Aenigmatarchaeota archaeon]